MIVMMTLTKGQSSPANLQSGQQPSKATLQMPQVSSLASHFQTATPDHERMLILSLDLDPASSPPAAPMPLLSSFSWPRPTSDREELGTSTKKYKRKNIREKYTPRLCYPH